MKVLLVEDNEAIILGLEFLLKEEGFACTVARTCKEALKLFAGDCFDIVILDIALPDGDGRKLCRNMKKIQNIPVIFLTARDEEQDVVEGFDVGGDDYIIKPFRNRELISRIRNVLRRSNKDTGLLHSGSLILDTRTGKVTNNGEEIPLTKLEYKILMVMMSNQGKLFTREEILSNIWDISGNFVNDNTLSVTMKRIREKIGDKEGQIIQTVRGMGYRIEKE